jgi:hypothetical protein
MCNKHQADNTRSFVGEFMKSFDGFDQGFDSKKKSARTKLWQLDHNYHCAVIGTCLTMAEVRKLLNSLDVFCKYNNAYDLHTAIVTMIAENNFRSKKVQHYLDKKFFPLIKKTKKMDAQALRIEWKRVVNTGDLVGTFWAIMSHPLTDEQMKRDFYGDIHMLSHLSGASNRVDLKRLTFLEKDWVSLKKESSSEQAKTQKLKVENMSLLSSIRDQEGVVANLNFQFSTLQEKHAELIESNREKQHQVLKAQVSKLNSQLAAQKNERLKFQDDLEGLIELVKTLERKQLSSQSEVEIYKEESEFLQSLLDQEKGRGDCQFKDQSLCGQCVLYVGGKKSLIPHYRELIEEKSGVFLHHDGGDEQNTQNLFSSLTRADIVIFPSSCISHEAYWKIKSVCKKQQKQFEYLSSPG